MFTAQSPIPTPTQRTDSLKRNQSLHSNNNLSEILNSTSQPGSPKTSFPPNSGLYLNSPKMPSSPYKYPTIGVNKGSNVPTPKGSPLRRPNQTHSSSNSQQDSPLRKIEEKWIDGPRMSR